MGHFQCLAFVTNDVFIPKEAEITCRLVRLIITYFIMSKVHVIPILSSFVSESIPAFLTTSTKYFLHFHELVDGVSLEETISAPSPTNPYGLPGGPFEEYFYLELPLSETTTKRRFVYVKNSKDKNFPMHFGLEVAANIIDRPERANWKNCMQSEQEETMIAENFRKAFESYDFT